MRKNSKVLYQSVEEAVSEQKQANTFVRQAENGEVHRGTFSITVKGAKGEELYKNDNEPFEYERVSGFSQMLQHAGAKLDDSQIEFLNQALSGSEETGKAVASIISMYNAKEKSDAKSSAYQSLVNKHKPIEGAQRETALARMVANFVRINGVTKEVAIAKFREINLLPEDYTVADFDATPLRRSKGSDVEDDE